MEQRKFQTHQYILGFGLSPVNEKRELDLRDIKPGYKYIDVTIKYQLLNMVYFINNTRAFKLSFNNQDFSFANLNIILTRLRYDLIPIQNYKVFLSSSASQWVDITNINSVGSSGCLILTLNVYY